MVICLGLSVHNRVDIQMVGDHGIKWETTPMGGSFTEIGMPDESLGRAVGGGDSDE